MTGLQIDSLEISKAGAPLVALNARVPPGEVLSVMGPSGIGKSTLLSAITGSLPPGFAATGRIMLNGHDITRLPPDRRRVGLLMQEDLLFPHLSVAGNLGFALPRRTPGRHARIEAALAEVGLEGFGPRDPATLSGGQKARVALMRMLLAEPEALLLDEPFSRLDATLREQVRQMVFARARARALPVLMVTHDAQDARAAGGPVIELGG